MTAQPDLTDSDSPVKRDPVGDADSISFQIQRSRVDAGLSIVELSKQTGISKTVLHGYERGRTKPGAREIRLLSAALRVSPNMLILGTDSFDENPTVFTTFYRKVRARPELAAVFYTMCMPLVASLLDEDEVQSIMLLLSGLIRARSPEISNQLMLAAHEAMISLDRFTVADGAISISPEELEALISQTQANFQNTLAQQSTEVAQNQK